MTTSVRWHQQSRSQVASYIVAGEHRAADRAGIDRMLGSERARLGARSRPRREPAGTRRASC